MLPAGDPNSCIQEEGLAYSWHSRWHVLPVDTSSSCSPSFTGVTWRCPGRYCIVSGSLSKLRQPECRKPQTLLLANLPNFCPWGRPHLYYPHQEANPFSTLQRNPIPIFQNINILEMIVKNKSCHKNCTNTTRSHCPTTMMVLLLGVTFTELLFFRHWVKPFVYILSSDPPYNPKSRQYYPHLNRNIAETQRGLATFSGSHMQEVADPTLEGRFIWLQNLCPYSWHYLTT